MINIFIIAVSLWALISFGINRKKDETMLFWIMVSSIWGYRTIEIYSKILIHPLDILLIVTFIWSWINPRPSSIPISNYLLVFISIIQLVLHKVSWLINDDLMECKGFIMILPSFILVYRVLGNNLKSLIVKCISTFILAMFFVALLGGLEYYFPSIASALPGYKINTELQEDTNDFFVRARFSFWGAATIGHIMVLTIPLFWLDEVRSAIGSKWKTRIIWFVIVVGVFLTGNRANWIQLLFFVFIYIFLYRPLGSDSGRFVKYLFVGLIVIIISIQLLPQAIIDRFATLFFAMQGEADVGLDSSGYHRQELYEFVLTRAKESPWGGGWFSVGLAHADFLQLTANLGWFAGLLLLLLLLRPLVKIIRLIFRLPETSNRRKWLIVFGTIQMVIVINIYRNGIYYVPQTGVYYFIFWAMAYNLSEQPSRYWLSHRGL